MSKAKFSFIVTLFLISGALLTQCTKQVGKPPVVAPPAVNVCDTVTYTKHIKPIIDGNCVGCHKASLQSGGTMLTTYNEVKDKGDAGRIKARVIDELPSRMPPGALLSKAQKDLITCWLNNGKKP